MNLDFRLAHRASRLARILPCFLSCVLACACSSSSSKDAAVDAGHGHEASSSTDATDATDATSNTTPDAGPDATFGSDVTDAGTPDVPIFALEAGVTWSSLYRDYFGPSGQASCAGDGNCHGAPDQPGYGNSGFLCPMGDASTACWAGITSLGDAGAYLIVPDAGFTNDQLSMVLCQDGGGVMPLFCTYTFTAVDLQRIGDWVNAGAPND